MSNSEQETVSRPDLGADRDSNSIPSISQGSAPGGDPGAGEGLAPGGKRKKPRGTFKNPFAAPSGSIRDSDGHPTLRRLLSAAAALPDGFRAEPWLGPVGLTRRYMGEALVNMASDLKALGFEAGDVLRYRGCAYWRGPRFEEALFASGAKASDAGFTRSPSTPPDAEVREIDLREVVPMEKRMVINTLEEGLRVDGIPEGRLLSPRMSDSRPDGGDSA